MALKHTTEQFIEKAKKVHQNPDGTPKYDYSKTIYKDAYTHVIITCPKHGDFLTQPRCHIGGSLCPKCGEELRANNRITKIQSFIEKARKIHGNKYDYSKVKYKILADKVTIICPIHGEFLQRAINHLKGNECPICAHKLAGIEKIKTTKHFIEKAQKVHQNPDGTPKYDYSKTKYIGSLDNLIITCPIHGDFTQIANNHLNGSGCQSCGTLNSKNELEILEFLHNYFDNIKHCDREILNNKELDIYIPDKHLAIEFNGLFWHSEACGKYAQFHLEKTKLCDAKNIQLIHIFEDEWLDKKEIVKSRLLNILGKTKFKIPARKCIIKQVPIKDERLFLENNHLQGYIASQICYGLYFTNPDNNKEYLVSLMSFGQLRKNLGSKSTDNVFEMYRFCNAKNFMVQGGASKLFKHFIKQFKPKQVISYADRRWSIDSEHNLYRQLGFEFQGYTTPSYFYIQKRKRINRFALRKDILIRDYGCPENMTEHDFCYSQGWWQIYDVGNIKYVWKK